MRHYNRGFFLEGAVGNNAFSLEERTQRKIYVPPYVDREDMKFFQGNQIAFAEVEEGKEKLFYGLDPFVRVQEPGRNIYIFDNHNHGFYAIFKEVFEGRISKGLPLVHFDQHKDTRIPPEAFYDAGSKEIGDFVSYATGHEVSEIDDLDRAFYYTNKVLNVGNFLVPLMVLQIISKVLMMDSSLSLSNAKDTLESLEKCILDIDLDFFSRDMDYLSYADRINGIRGFIPKAVLITVCTSPFFVEFERANTALKDIFEGNMPIRR